MLSSHWQCARVCRALCMAAALCLLPQGAAWAGQDVTVQVTPLTGTMINSFPYPIAAYVWPPQGEPSPAGTVNFKVNGYFVGSSTVNNYSAPFNLQADHFIPEDGNGRPNYVEADYLGDGCFSPGSDTVVYEYYGPPRVRENSARTRANSAPTRAGRAAHPAVRSTKTKLTPLPPNPGLGQYIEFSAQVTDCADAFVYPQGNVDFCDTTNNKWVGAVNVSRGFAKLTLPADHLGVGSHLVTAKFTPSEWFGASSDWATVTVLPSHGKAKRQAVATSPPRAECSPPARDKPRRGMRQQAPPAKGTR